MNTVKNRRIVYNGHLRIEQAELTGPGGDTHTKERVNREDAAVVLLFNTDSRKLVLTRQFRYAVYDKTSRLLLEAVAGKVEDEDPLHTAIRETEEEAGYRIRPQNISLLGRCFSSPGYTTECYHIYYAEASDSDKAGKGGGKAEEHEHIELVELTPQEFYSLLDAGELEDAKTCLAGLLVRDRLAG